ncbi:MAG: chromosomal replication initiator protein DnaA [Kiritimatiellae bacterium]|nr:chromosomal replication initiator protein DnaA [Kiritimatiellia bacterium]
MDKSAATIWSKACKHLAQVLSKDVYDRWIALIQATEIKDATLILRVANDFYQSWLEENYLPLIRDAVAAVADQDLKIALAVDTDVAVAIDEPERPVRSAITRRLGRRRTEEIQLNPKFTFDTFVVGPTNNFAHAASLAVAQSPARAYNPLFIYGGVGLGKTHLMQAIGHYMLAKSRPRICYMSSESFLNEYIDALQRKAVVEFRKKYRSMDALMIDDIHFLAGKERMQEEFFHTFNALFENQKQIILASDRPASDITGLEHRLVSRFEWGLVTELEPPDIETRIAILRAKQAQLNLKLPDEVILYIAERVRANIRRLEGALIRSASYASLTGRELTMESLENLLRDTLDQESQEALTIETIQRVVADYYDIRLGDMTSKRRPKAIAFPRQVAMYLCRSLTPHSLPTIGNAFGRNHATVIHACRLVGDRTKNDPAFRQSLSVLKQKLGHRS